jgi:hypothetical protein
LNSTLFDFDLRIRASPKLDPIWDASTPSNPTPRPLENNITSIADSDTSSTEDSIGQPFEEYGLVHIEYLLLFGHSHHSLFAVLPFSLLTPF